jgi:MFS superfamily sulfate permease-like transporter
MPEKSLLADMQGTLAAAGWAILWALSGRLLYVMNLVRIGKRKEFFSVQTVWELGVAVGMGVVAGGLSEYLGLEGLTSAGFIAAVSYLGPHIIEVLLTLAAQKAGLETPATPHAHQKGEE